MPCQISPRRTCNPGGDTMKIGCRYHRFLIYNVKRTTKIDGMGPFKAIQKYQNRAARLVTRNFNRDVSNQILFEHLNWLNVEKGCEIL